MLDLLFRKARFAPRACARQPDSLWLQVIRRDCVLSPGSVIAGQTRADNGERGSGAPYAGERIFLAKRCDGQLRVFKNLEKAQHADQLERLNDKFGRVEELQRSAALFGRGEMTHQ